MVIPIRAKMIFNSPYSGKPENQKPSAPVPAKGRNNSHLELNRSERNPPTMYMTRLTRE